MLVEDSFLQYGWFLWAFSGDEKRRRITLKVQVKQYDSYFSKWRAHRPFSVPSTSKFELILLTAYI